MGSITFDSLAAFAQTTTNPSLEAFVSNNFFLTVIQDQDEIFEFTYNKNWSRKAKVM